MMNKRVWWIIAIVVALLIGILVGMNFSGDLFSAPNAQLPGEGSSRVADAGDGSNRFIEGCSLDSCQDAVKLFSCCTNDCEPGFDCNTEQGRCDCAKDLADNSESQPNCATQDPGCANSPDDPSQGECEVINNPGVIPPEECNGIYVTQTCNWLGDMPVPI